MAANCERTFIAVKPDGVQRGLVGEIIKRFEQKGFRLVGMKFVQVRVRGSSGPNASPPPARIGAEVDASACAAFPASEGEPAAGVPSGWKYRVALRLSVHRAQTWDLGRFLQKPDLLG